MDIVDGYCESTNTIYEFDGDFIHGNPKYYNPEDTNGLTGKTFGELYEATLKKRETILKAGYNLVHIWEDDFYRSIIDTTADHKLVKVAKIAIKKNERLLLSK